jgi:riboflavin synthase
MFTGIVTEVGTASAVTEGDGLRTFTITAPATADGLKVGDSVAVAGVCLTAVEVADGSFTVEAVPETLSRTTLGAAAAGAALNLERPMAASGRFDGHIVQGHVDGVATVRSVTPEGDSRRVWLDLDARLLPHVVEKGSITLDGVSLTVTATDDTGFEVALIPHTLDVTTLGDLEAGDAVNAETDVLAKYVERMLEART